MSSTPGDLPPADANNANEAEDALGPDTTEAELLSLLSSISAGLGGSGEPPADDLAATEATAGLAAQVSIADHNHHAALETTAAIRQLSLLEFLQ